MKRTRLSDISKNPDEQLVDITAEELVPLPYPYDKPGKEPPVKPLTEEQKARYESSLDGVSAIGIPRPKSKEEEDKLVQSFLSGLKKLLSKKDNWTFLQPLILSLENCAKCLNCSEECQIYLSSGRQEVYRPTYRSEVLRRIIKKYLGKRSKFFSKFSEGDIELNWATIARLAELAYRCPACLCSSMCYRCGQWLNNPRTEKIV